MKAKIKDKREVTKGTLSVDFDLLGNEVNFEPGQYITVRLINPPFTDAKGSQRYFSINNPPGQKGVFTITTRIRDSAFKKSLSELPTGTEVEIDPPRGVFVLPKETIKPLVFIAGGIGITPFLSMLRHIRDGKLDYKITLIYSNKDKESTAFLQEFEDMAKNNSNFKLIAAITQDPGWSGEKRRIDAQFIKDYFKNPNDYLYYAAGPPGMVDAIYDALINAGIGSSNIETENFAGY
ncbi:MAG: FAD-dependent oxidoreductase [Candidatus Levybacteria bacterium]|nr:FAD-dependent oxidoreductase [Candidatus Levybacteria bacterium]